MKTQLSLRPLFLGFAIVLSFALSGCADLNYPSQPYSPGYNSAPPPPPYYGNDWNRRQHEEYEVQREHERNDEEKRRLDAERNAQRHQAPPPPKHEELHCPAGTHPSTHRCTNDERKRGCKDYGAGNGQGCSNF